MWIFRAYDEYGLPVAEAYHKSDLIEKLIEEFGEERLQDFTIKKVFESWLR